MPKFTHNKPPKLRHVREAMRDLVVSRVVVTDYSAYASVEPVEPTAPEQPARELAAATSFNGRRTVSRGTLWVIHEQSRQLAAKLEAASSPVEN